MSQLFARYHKFIIGFMIGIISLKKQNKNKALGGVPAGQSEDMNFDQSPELVSIPALPETALQAERNHEGKGWEV